MTLCQTLRKTHKQVDGNHPDNSGCNLANERVIESDLPQLVHLCTWRQLLVVSNHTLFESNDVRTSSVKAPSITVSLKLVACTLRLRG